MPLDSLGILGGHFPSESPKREVATVSSQNLRYHVCHFQDTGMETVVRGMPLEYPPKPERLNAYGKPRKGSGKITECERGRQRAGWGSGGT